MEVLSNSRNGFFMPIGNHEAEGSAMLVRQTNGSLLLSFSDDFMVTDGPGLYVYLSNVSGVNDDSFQIAELTSPSGAQAYQIDDVDLYAYNYVVVYCVPFSVPFGSAPFE